MLILPLLAPKPSIVRIIVRPNTVLRRFVPDTFFGAGLDGSDQGSVERTFRDHNVEAMQSVGFRSLTYRLRTELGGEAWHWNPDGVWSDPEHHQGYWTGNPVPDRPIEVSWGYRLPRRGNTVDQANDDGYSRIDDGDPNSYWKSNPYLDPALSGDRQFKPQWIVVDLDQHAKIDALRIRWANPFATHFRVEYWQGAENFEEDDDPEGAWHVFPNGDIRSRHGGDQILRLGGHHSVRFLRVTLLQSSHTSESGSRDSRDRMGFAVREIEAGRMSNGGILDEIDHQAKKTQTPIYVSSTDPWHREEDRDPQTEQPGFDRVFRSRLSFGFPALIPAAVLYDTPENAAAEIRWLKARNYPIRGVELGEEPDGQCVDPEQYASLYRQVALQIRRIDPRLRLGGPCFQTALFGFSQWPDHRPKSWMRRFIDNLKSDQALKLLDFFSFEWYPFDRPFGDSTPNVPQNAPLFRQAIAQMRKDGLPANLPWSVTEYGYSAFSGPHDVKLESALVNLDTVGQSLTLGAEAAYLYGYEPSSLIFDYQNQWGNLATWLVDPTGNALTPLPMYWAARMMTQDWCLPGLGSHALLKSISSDPLITSYAVRRPDGKISVLLLNKDSHRARMIRLWNNGQLRSAGMVVQYGPGEFAWQPAGALGHPVRSAPPRHGMLNGHLILPPYSITVVTENL